MGGLATMVINAVIGYMMQHGLGGMMSGGGQDGDIMSALSNFMVGNNACPNSEMVKHIQRTCGIQDPYQASQYTQQAVNIMNEQGNSNPSGIESILWVEANHNHLPRTATTTTKEKRFPR